RIHKRSADVAGFISLAGSARPLEDLVVDQTEYLISLDGEQSKEEDERLAEVKRQAKKIKSPELSADAKIAELPLGAPAKYWLDLRGYDPAREAAALNKPLLILQGERDYQVTMQDFGMWKKSLESRADVQFIRYPRLNHLFMSGKGKSTPSEYLTPGNVAEKVVIDAANWIKARARK
ncbi:MAG: hypothetical protein N2C14_16980, partial [Planctomycetales bacterium]